jgi:ABC-2 type transport system permease protein
MNTVYIMWLREMKRYIRSYSRLLGSLAQPILFLLAFGYGFGALYSKAGEGNYIAFLAPGIIGMAIIFTSIFNGVQVIWDRQFGFLKETLVAPVSRVSVMFGRALGGASVATIQGCIVLIVTTVVGFRPSLTGALLSIGVMLLVGLLFSSLGLAVGSRMRDFQGFQLVMNFLVQPLFFLSGALFPLTNVPALLGLIARADPLAYGVDAMRGLLIGTSVFGLGLDLAVLVMVTAVFVVLGSWSFSIIEA